MILLLFFLSSILATPQDSNWKAKRLAIVVQHSGTHRTNSAGIVNMLERILAMRPEAAEAGIIGYDRDFEQLEGARFRRRPILLQPLSTDGDGLREAVRGMVFHGPSPIWDGVMLALEQK